MNLAPIADAAISVASAVLTACVPIVVWYFARKVGFEKDTAMRDSLTTALQRGVGDAMATGKVTADTKLADVHISSPAVASIAAYAAEVAPDAVAHFGLTTDEISQKAAAELALALNVPAAAPSPTMIPISNPTPSRLIVEPVAAHA